MKSSRKSLLVGAMALAGLAGVGQVQSAQASASPNTLETSATARASKEKTIQQKNKIVNEVGGIPIVSEGRQFGMTPKEYGMRYGNGGSSVRTS